LLYGDEFLLGVRVLGKSIRDTGSTKDIVVLVSDGVSDYAKKLLLVIFFLFFIYICLVSEKIQL
jgi:di/tricarboxylate transporter